MKKITEIVLATVKEVGEDHENDALIGATEDTRLFGENLDSMGVVFLITDLETVISDEFNLELSLADERAMSQKTSPFRTVKTLSKYVELLVTEQQED
jgi:acyl carrier protein